MTDDTVSIRHDGPVAIVTIARPERRNAVDRATAEALHAAFKALDADPAVSVMVLTGAEGNFCAGADLKALAEGVGGGNRIPIHGDEAPMGPTRMTTQKPVIAAVEGFAVAGGLELALWADMRVAGRGATFGVYCRRFGVPLVDLGTVRLPRLIGHSRAMDMILTGRAVGAQEALAMGLANRVVDDGEALAGAIALGHQIAAFPQACLRNDRASALAQWSLGWDAAAAHEAALGLETLRSGETAEGAARFTSGIGRHGQFSPDSLQTGGAHD